MVRNRQTAGACRQVLVRAGEACALDVAPSASTQLRRSVLLGTVAAGMLLFGYGRVARAGPGPCVTSGSTATCTGNQSDGIEGGTDFDETIVSTLKVNSLDRDIAPAAGVDGISFFRFGSLTINSNTTDGPGGPFAITTKGDFAYGIHAYSFAGSATVTHIGDIHTSGYYGVGINAAGFRSVRITHTGDISTKGDLADGIYADSYGSVTINQTGNISTTGFFAFGI